MTTYTPISHDPYFPTSGPPPLLGQPLSPYSVVANQAAMMARQRGRGGVAVRRRIYRPTGRAAPARQQIYRSKGRSVRVAQDRLRAERYAIYRMREQRNRNIQLLIDAEKAKGAARAASAVRRPALPPAMKPAYRDVITLIAPPAPAQRQPPPVRPSPVLDLPPAAGRARYPRLPVPTAARLSPEIEVRITPAQMEAGVKEFLATDPAIQAARIQRINNMKRKLGIKIY